MKGTDALINLIRALEAADLSYMVVGSYSSQPLMKQILPTNLPVLAPVKQLVAALCERRCQCLVNVGFARSHSHGGHRHAATSVTILLTIILAYAALTPSAHACCAVTRDGSLVVNADQTVIMIWDRSTQTQHFIRQANFKTDAADVGFIVPSPSRPTLAEAGNAAFATLAEITAPYVRTGGGFSLGCSAADTVPRQSSVRVIEQKRVAGYDTTVLTARSGADLVEWLQKNGYPHSAETAAWAAPYLGGDWHFTAMKVAKQETGEQDINASALRITFRTNRPLFPYREPDSSAAMRKLNAPARLLRIHFIADARYTGALEGGGKWTGKAVWSDDITHHRERLLRELKLPASTGPERWILTEFEDRWPYRKAAGDLYFSKATDQSRIDTRSTFAPPPRDAGLLAAFVFLCVHRLGRSSRRRRAGNLASI